MATEGAIVVLPSGIPCFGPSIPCSGPFIPCSGLKAGMRWCHEMALEFVCLADFWCDFGRSAGPARPVVRPRGPRPHPAPRDPVATRAYRRAKQVFLNRNLAGNGEREVQEASPRRSPAGPDTLGGVSNYIAGVRSDTPKSKHHRKPALTPKTGDITENACYHRKF